MSLALDCPSGTPASHFLQPPGKLSPQPVSFYNPLETGGELGMLGSSPRGTEKSMGTEKSNHEIEERTLQPFSKVIRSLKLMIPASAKATVGLPLAPSAVSCN